ncbi:MAG: hypothetical protein IKA70_03615 [Alistipes sp.]|nr:hypothetical protein [Alistipes sp.]
MMNNRTFTTILVLLSLATIGVQQTLASNSRDDVRQQEQERADERAERLLKNHIRHYEDEYYDVDPSKYGYDSYVAMANAYRNNEGQAGLSYYLYCLAAQDGEKEAYYYLGKFYERDYESDDMLWHHDTDVAQAFYRLGAERGCDRSKSELVE